MSEAEAVKGFFSPFEVWVSIYIDGVLLTRRWGFCTFCKMWRLFPCTGLR